MAENGENIGDNQRTHRKDRLDYCQLSGEGHTSLPVRSRKERSTNQGKGRALPAIEENDSEGILLSSESHSRIYQS